MLLSDVQRMFLLSRMTRGCAPATLTFYKWSYEKLCQFVGHMFSADFLNVGTQVDAEFPELSPIQRNQAIGVRLPIAVLEHETFHADYMRWLRQSGNDQTVKSYLRGYRAFAYFAMEKGYIEQRKITVGGAETAIKNCYTDAELGRLLAMPNKDDFIEYRNWVIVNFLLATGCRVSTLVDMNIGDIDFEEGMLNLNRQKNKSPVRVPLVRKLSKVLENYIADYMADFSPKEPLFPRLDGTRASEDIIKQSIARYNKKRKVSKTSIHLFRHTFAKNWILGGGDLITLQRMLNHKSLTMVQHYANLYGADIKPHAEQYSLLNRIEQTRNSQKLVRRSR